MSRSEDSLFPRRTHRSLPVEEADSQAAAGVGLTRTMQVINLVAHEQTYVPLHHRTRDRLIIARDAVVVGDLMVIGNFLSDLAHRRIAARFCKAVHHKNQSVPLRVNVVVENIAADDDVVAGHEVTRAEAGAEEE